jgi:hypothetical protein
MDNTNYIIAKALEGYDNSSNVIKYLADRQKTSIKLEREKKQNQRALFVFRDNKTNEIVLSTEMELLGIYYDNIWCWAWTIPTFENLDILLAKELLMYALKMGPEYAIIKSMMINSRGTVDDPIQVDINIALATYILKYTYIYPVKTKINDTVITKYYILLNREELSKLTDKLSVHEKSD